ncbi:MAG: hypothetical protein FWE61_04790, partial [Micrococcales bacterium]|nr:hypothetical protein [Micrococcales bacterium]
IARFSSQVEADDRVLAALDGWATCMAGKGYEHATPDEARESITARTRVDGKPITGADLQALRAEEIATAVDDHACSTDLEQTRAAVLAELETAYYEENTTEVDAFFTQFEQFLARGHD